MTLAPARPELTTADHLASMMTARRADLLPELARVLELNRIATDTDLDFDERATAETELEELSYGYENFGVHRYCDGTARAFVAVGGPSLWFDFEIGRTRFGFPIPAAGSIGGAWGFSPAEPLPLTTDEADAAWGLLNLDVYLDPFLSADDALPVECAADYGRCENCAALED